MVTSFLLFFFSFFLLLSAVVVSAGFVEWDLKKSISSKSWERTLGSTAAAFFFWDCIWFCFFSPYSTTAI
jgi:hypothetical protein